jgi:hypothetical protein
MCYDLISRLFGAIGLNPKNRLMSINSKKLIVCFLLLVAYLGV